jgi:hypothetical protein
MAINIDGNGLITLGGTASTQGRVRLSEDTDNGTNYIELTAPASVASDKTITFPDATGTVVISGTTPSLNGITFPATQVASADANTLDDYEEGTFTVTALLPNASGTITVSATQDTLKYTKIGRVVFINGFVQPSSVASPVGFYIQLNGLPFNTTSSSSPTTGANSQSGVAIFYYNSTAGTGQASRPITVPNNGGTVCFIFVDASTVANTTEIYVNINYAV